MSNVKIYGVAMRLMMLISILIANPAIADTRKIAESLGTALAAESFCGLRYDDDVLNTWVDDRIHYSDRSFFVTLDAVIDQKERQQMQMNGAQRARHCSSILGLANHHHFLEDGSFGSQGIAHATTRVQR